MSSYEDSRPAMSMSDTRLGELCDLVVEEGRSSGAGVVAERRGDELRRRGDPDNNSREVSVDVRDVPVRSPAPRALCATSPSAHQVPPGSRCRATRPPLPCCRGS